jgi:hypothetical protein
MSGVCLTILEDIGENEENNGIKECAKLTHVPCSPAPETAHQEKPRQEGKR